MKRPVALNSSPKMFQKKYFVLGVVIIYIILITIAFALQRHYSPNISCYSKKPCVRFCCENKQTCSEEFIEKNFNGSLVPNYLPHLGEEVDGFQSLLSKPDCWNLQHEGQNFEFEEVSFLQKCCHSNNSSSLRAVTSFTTKFNMEMKTTVFKM